MSRPPAPPKNLLLHSRAAEGREKGDRNAVQADGSGRQHCSSRHPSIQAPGLARPSKSAEAQRQGARALSPPPPPSGSTWTGPTFQSSFSAGFDQALASQLLFPGP